MTIIILILLNCLIDYFIYKNINQTLIYTYIIFWLKDTCLIIIFTLSYIPFNDNKNQLNNNINHLNKNIVNKLINKSVNQKVNKKNYIIKNENNNILNREDVEVLFDYSLDDDALYMKYLNKYYDRTHRRNKMK